MRKATAVPRRFPPTGANRSGPDTDTGAGMQTRTPNLIISLASIAAMLTGCGPTIVGHRVNVAPTATDDGLRVVLTRQALCEGNSGSRRKRTKACGQSVKVNNPVELKKGRGKIKSLSITFSNDKTKDYHVDAASGALVPWKDIVDHLPRLRRVDDAKVAARPPSGNGVEWKLGQFRSKGFDAELKRAEEQQRQERERQRLEGQAKRQEEQTRERQRLVEQARRAVEAASASCRSENAVEIIAKLPVASQAIDELRTATSTAQGLDDQLRRSCLSVAPKLVRLAKSGLKKNDPYAAHEAAQVAAWIDPSPGSPPQVLLERVSKAIEKVAPVRVKDVAAFEEGGSGIAAYIILATATGKLTAAAGQVTVSVDLIRRGAAYPCYKIQKRAQFGDFEIATLGVGGFAHKSLIYKLPWLPYEKFTCPIFAGASFDEYRIGVAFLPPDRQELYGKTTVMRRR